MTNSTDRSQDTLRLKRAFHAIEKLQAKLDALEYAKTEPIVVIGIGCRFPGGADGCCKELGGTAAQTGAFEFENHQIRHV